MSVFDGLPDIFTDAFGEAVTVTPSGGDAREINAIFRRRPREQFGSGIGGRVAFEATISARTVDVSDIADGDAVAIGSRSYEVRAIQPDDKGMSMLTLRSV
jgi:hypothetical protein